MRKTHWRRIRRVDVQVSIFTAVIVILSCLCIFAFHYQMTYRDMIASLTDRVYSIYSHLESSLDKEAFTALRSPGDMDTALYQENRQTFESVKSATGVRYLYTATRNEAGEFIYLVDGLPLDAADFRRPGDAIEPEIIPELEAALAGREVMPDDIKDTGWGKIFISYLPIHDDGSNAVVGVVGIEFEADRQFDTYRALRIATPLIVLLACLVSVLFALFFFRRISNPTYRDLYNTDQLTQIKNRNAFNVDLENLSPADLKRLGLLFMDLNDLKLVNDTLGHGYGDLYLQASAQALAEAAAGREVPYRTGGDEFALIVPQATPERMRALAEALSGYFKLHPRSWTVQPSLAVGWAIYDPEADSSIDDTCRRADALMYECKRAYHQSAGLPDAES